MCFLSSHLGCWVIFHILSFLLIKTNKQTNKLLISLANSWQKDLFFFLPMFSLSIAYNVFKLYPCVCFCGKRKVGNGNISNEERKPRWTGFCLWYFQLVWMKSDKRKVPWMNSFQPWLKILGSQEYCRLKSLSTFSSFRATKNVLMRGSAKPRGTELESSSLSPDALCLPRYLWRSQLCIKR